MYGRTNTIAPRMQLEATQACEKVAAEEKLVVWDGNPNTRPPTVFDAILRSNLPVSEKTVGRLDHDAFTAIFGGGDPAARTFSNEMYAEIELRGPHCSS
jgi:hypothetical protein